MDHALSSLAVSVSSRGFSTVSCSASLSACSLQGSNPLSAATASTQPDKWWMMVKLPSFQARQACSKHNVFRPECGAEQRTGTDLTLLQTGHGWGGRKAALFEKSAVESRRCLLRSEHHPSLHLSSQLQPGPCALASAQHYKTSPIDLDFLTCSDYATSRTRTALSVRPT